MIIVANLILVYTQTLSIPKRSIGVYRDFFSLSI
jgi:hypothetical protein